MYDTYKSKFFQKYDTYKETYMRAERARKFFDLFLRFVF